MTELALTFPPEVVEAIAQRAAELVLEQLEEQRQGDWPEFMTPETAARYLDCAPQRVYDLRSKGRLRRYNDGGRALVSRAQLDAYVASADHRRGRRRVAPASPPALESAAGSGSAR